MYQPHPQVELFQGLGAIRIQRLSEIGTVRSLRAGEYLFLLGDSAEYVSVVLRGQMDLCFPMTVGGVLKDIAVETAGPGRTIGWSALVRPFRFTLSARASSPTEVVGFARHDLQRLFEDDPVIARAVLTGISELVANRLAMFQALWARELQRAVDAARELAGRANG